MNVFVHLLESDTVAAEPETAATKIAVEDNVGESIHIHLRNFRLEMSVEDFEQFADNLLAARTELHDGDR